MAIADCPRCGGSGWKTVDSSSPSGAAARPDFFGARMAVRCDCTLSDRRAQILSRTRIPRRYEHCDFENFDTDHYEGPPQAPSWNKSLEQAKLVVQAFARDYPVSAEGGLLLMGPCGAGKTHLAVAALKEIVLRNHSGLFYDYRELLKQIQDSYNPDRPSTELEVLEPVLQAELLVLDDVGSSKPSAWALETVGHILNTRYNRSLPTLLTTNYLDAAPVVEPLRLPGGQSVARPDSVGAREDSFADRVGQRIRSRLYEMCRTVEILVPDYRKEIRQAGRVGFR